MTKKIKKNKKFQYQKISLYSLNQKTHKTLIDPKRQKEYWQSQNAKDKTICVAGIKNYDEQEKWFWELLYEKIFVKINNPQEKFLLDVCCGNGRCIDNYRKYYGNVGLTDQNPYFIRISEQICHAQKLNTVFISEIDLSKLLFPKKIQWDLILCNFALLNLDHMDLEHFIFKCKDALKIGGYIVIKETFARRTYQKFGEQLDMFGGVVYRTVTQMKSVFNLKYWTHIITKTQLLQTAIIYQRKI